MTRARRERARTQLREQSGFANAGVYDPPSIGGTHVIYVLHDATNPEVYGGLPANPQIPAASPSGSGFAKPIGLFLALLAAPVAFFHYIAEGRKKPQPPSRREVRAMTTAVNRVDEAARRRVGAYGRTTVGQDELLRHPVYTRLLHWTVAIFFVLALALRASPSTRHGCSAG